MEIRDRILAGIATSTSDDSTVDVDITTLVHRLVLFEQVVVKSTRLKEVPALVKVFGEDGLRDLLDSRVLRLTCEAMTIGQIGQIPSSSSTPLPLGSYRFAILHEGDRREYLHSALQEIHAVPGLSDKQVRRLKRKVVDSILPPKIPYAAVGALVGDAAGNLEVVAAAVERAIARELGRAPDRSEIRIRVEQLQPNELHVETNLQPLLSVDLQREHDLVTNALLGIGAMNQRIAEMQLRQGVSAFDERELPLVDTKLAFLLRDVLPDDQERRFERVLEVTNLVEPDLTEARTVDVDRLLQLRESPECREMRAWLRQSDGLTDDQLREMLPGLREKMAHAIRGRIGRGARFVVSTGAGLAAGEPTGIAGSVLDTFILERLLPRPGPLAWLALRYPSIFPD